MMRPVPRSRSAREGGFALLLVLLLSLILLPFAVEFAMQVRLESQTAVNVTSELQIENEIDGQYEIMLARLRYDSQENQTESYYDSWNDDELTQRQSEDTQVAVTTHVFDEQGKFNLLQLATSDLAKRKKAKERLARIIVEFRRDTDFEVTQSEAESWTNAITDWVGKGPGRANIPKANTKDDRAILVLDELDLLAKVGDHRASFLLRDQRKGEESALGLHRYVTIYGDGKLNVNTADEIVLKAYFGRNPELAERILERRDNPPTDEDSFGSSDDEGSGGNPFTAVEQINEVEGVTAPVLVENGVDLNADFTVRSSFFSLRIVGESESSRRDELFVIERVPGAAPEEPIEGFRLLLRQPRIDVLERVSSDDG